MMSADELVQEDERLLNRRRTLVLGGALGLGLLTGIEMSPSASGRKKKKIKSGKKDKKKKSEKSKQSSGKGTGSDIVREAQKYKGSRYVSGGESPKGFDCSGF